MANVNKVFLIGRLTSDPELRWTAGQAAVSDLRLATNRIYTTKEGDRREETLFIDVTVWNRQAENCHQYLKKGSLIHVEGFLKMESWETPAGEKRTKIKVEAERVQFLDRRDPLESPTAAEDDYAPPPAREPRRGAPSPDNRAGNSLNRGYGTSTPAPRRPVAPPADPESDDDIPF